MFFHAVHRDNFPFNSVASLWLLHHHIHAHCLCHLLVLALWMSCRLTFDLWLPSLRASCRIVLFVSILVSMFQSLNPDPPCNRCLKFHFVPNSKHKHQVGQYKVKVKRTLVQAIRLCTGCTAHRGSRGIALLFHDHGIRRVWGVSVTPRPLFTPGTHCTGGWMGPRAGLDKCGKSRPPTAIRSPDRPARSQSLYRLRHLAH